MTPNITHHPDATTLVDYASGALVASLAAVVATHLLLCPQCRRGMKTLEAVGGALMGDGDDPNTILPPLRMPKKHTPLVAAASTDGELLPSAALAAFGLRQGIPWRPLGVGVRHYRIPTGRDGGDLRLMKIAAEIGRAHV